MPRANALSACPAQEGPWGVGRGKVGWGYAYTGEEGGKEGREDRERTEIRQSPARQAGRRGEEEEADGVPERRVQRGGRGQVPVSTCPLPASNEMLQEAGGRTSTRGKGKTGCLFSCFGKAAALCCIIFMYVRKQVRRTGITGEGEGEMGEGE